MSTITLTPVEDFLEAYQLNQLIACWLDSISVADTTRKTYRGKIKHFVDWWDREGPRRDWRLTPTALKEFECHLRGVIAEQFNRPLSYLSRHAVIRALRMMFKWAARTERTVKNYGEWVPWPVGNPPEREAATPEQLAKLMLAVAKSKWPERDQALLAFFIGTGCRIGEVCKLRAEGLRILADGSGTVMVIGKRTPANKTGRHAIAFDAVTGRYLIRYLDTEKIVSGPLWISNRGKPLSQQGIYMVVKRAIGKAGLTGQVCGCHDLRRAFATILSVLHADSPVWADMIRRQLGHKHYSQTAKYTLVQVDDIREILQSPLLLR